MTGVETPAVTWLLTAVEAIGLFSAWIARLSEGSRRQTLCQRQFIGCLALVGGATIVALGLGPGCWLAGGVTLSLMVLTVTCDNGRARRAAAW